jgi:hypothetical protein
MNIYSPDRIQAHKSALLKSIDDEKKSFCNKKCKGEDECLNKCQIFFNWATFYGIAHFDAVHKYTYTPTANEEEE